MQSHNYIIGGKISIACSSMLGDYVVVMGNQQLIFTIGYTITRLNGSKKIRKEEAPRSMLPNQLLKQTHNCFYKCQLAQLPNWAYHSVQDPFKTSPLIAPARKSPWNTSCILKIISEFRVLSRNLG